MTILFLTSPAEVWRVDYCPCPRAAAAAGRRGWGREGQSLSFIGGRQRLQVWLADRTRWLSQFSGFDLILS